MPEGSTEGGIAPVGRRVAAAEVIGRRIVSGDWQPGSVLPNLDKLAEEFAVSRLSIREAMKLLAGKGLVDARPRRGTVVRPRNEWSRLDPDVLFWQAGKAPNAAFVRSLFEVRGIIEPEAAALAAVRSSEEALAGIDRAFSAMEASDPTIAGIDQGRRSLSSGDPDRHRQRVPRRLRAGDRDVAHRHLRRSADRPAASGPLHPQSPGDLRGDPARRRRRRPCGLQDAAGAGRRRRDGGHPHEGRDP